MKVKRIEEIDKNFVVKTNEQKDTIYVNALEEIIEIYGLWGSEDEKTYCRLPQTLLKKFPEAVQSLAWHTSGGRARFMSDSPYVCIKAEIISDEDMSHMPRSGSSGFDIYIGSKENKRYTGSVMPGYGITSYEGIVYAREMGFHEWTINFPLYNGIKNLFIGFHRDSILKKAHAYSIVKPVVFYGSSITQGGCASRPGNAYPSIISRWLDANIYNLGFSGSAKGEPEMAEFIAGLDMSALVMDYDHNAPTVEHLAETHEPFFKTIRKARPSLPILFISKPDFESEIQINTKRRGIIFQTYKNAISSGDKSVYFVDGETLFGKDNKDSCTVDGCHPNDLGFMRMAEGIYPVLKKALV